jgi:hypothetical protein
MNMFGPSKDRVWKEFSDAIGGSIHPGGFSDGWWGGESGILARYKGLEIIFDTYQDFFNRMPVRYTRIRTRYNSSSPLNFIVRSKTFSDLLLGLMPHYFAKIGDREFDWSFSCKASNELALLKLLSFPIIRHLLKDISNLELKSRDKDGWGIFNTNFPAGTLELCLRVPGIEKDPAKLNRLYQLFTEVLDRLAEIGARTEDGSH